VTDLKQDWEVIVAPPTYEEDEAIVLQQTSEPVQDTGAPPQEDTRDATPIREVGLHSHWTEPA
jgi:hypothetical protein